MTTTQITNERIAEAIEQLAILLEERGDNPHRIQAYLTAAQTVRGAERPLQELYHEGGLAALKALPGIGDSISARIAAFIETGRLALVEELRRTLTPEVVFTRVTGIGEELARRIHEQLGVSTLEELEMAAYDGRLEQVEGFGSRRVRAVRHQLAAILTRETRRRLRKLRNASRRGRDPQPSQLPSVRELLNADLEYRVRGTAGELEMIAPARFNPSGAAWMPVLHTRRGRWRLTALYSNSPRAHQLDRTHDWVVVYYESEGFEGQATIVTETRGDLKGLRVVRGREAECLGFYTEQPRRAA